MARGKILPPLGDGFGIVPGRMILASSISATARALYAVVWYHRVMSPDFPPLEDLASQIGVKSKGAVIAAIEELEAAKWILVVRVKGKANDYQLLDGQGATVEVSAEAHAARVEKAKESKVKGFKELVDWWSAAFEKRWGKKYLFNGSKDGAAVKRFLSHFTADEFKGLVKAAWETPDRRDFSTRTVCQTLAGLSSMANQIVVPKAAAAKKELTDEEILAAPDEKLRPLELSRKWNLQGKAREQAAS